MKIKITQLPDNLINTHIKPIEKEDANAEIEKNEIVFNPNTFTLHKALGKKHSSGGTPVNLNDGAFIFSDYKKLAFDKGDVEEMEFKEGGKFSKKSAYTPSKVLGRQVDIKHHNKMLDVIQKNKGDQILQNSAQLMLAKNLEQVGRVAFKQEEKKQFRQGVPDISEGTAPVYSDEIDQQMIQAKQYSGEKTYDPQKNKDIDNRYQRGGSFVKRAKYQPTFKPYDSNNLPEGYGDPDYIQGLSQWLNKYNNYGATGEAGVRTARSWQGQNTPWAVTAAGDMGYWNRNQTDDKNYIDPRVKYDAFAVDTNPDWNLSWTPLDSTKYGANRVYRVDPETGRAIFAEGQKPLTPRVNNTEQRLVPTAGTPEAQLPSAKPLAGASPGNPDLPAIATQYDVGLTPWQKINMAIPFARAAAVKTYYPIRQQQESVITTPDLQSAQPYLNQNNQAYFNAAQLAKFSSNPAAIIQQLAGTRQDANNQAIGNVENQNISTINTGKANNAALLNSDAQQNRAFDLAYKENVDRALQNRDDMRDFLNNQGLTNANSVLSQVETTNLNLNSLPQIKTTIPVKDKNGVTIGYKAGLQYEPTKGFFGQNTRYNPNLDPKAVLNYQSGLGTTNANILEAKIADLTEQMNSETNNFVKSSLIRRIALLENNLYKTPRKN